MAEEEGNDPQKPRVRFGRRVRSENQNQGNQNQGQGAPQEGPRKPKVRIGPKNRRGDQSEMALVPPTASPRREDVPRGAHPGKGRPDRDRNAGQNPQEQGGQRRKRRRRNKGRRPEDAQPKPLGNGESPEPPKPQDGRVGQSFRPVLPPVEDDLDEVPSGIFEADDSTDSDIDDDSEVDDYEDPSDLPSGDGDASSLGGEHQVSNPGDPGSRQGGQGRETRSSRDRKRRKKRRERQEPIPVDRSTGFWWVEQWIRSFEMLFPSNASRSRLAKGRTYARRGQVLELEVGPNGVLARVQGSRPRPYQVRLELNRLRRETWGRILHQLVGKATFLAQLLEGHLPPEIEEVFFSAGARLFPHGDVDVRARCNCPDPVAPCKHVAALNYALADALQRDPFLLFAMRGKSRDQFLQDLREMRGRDRQNAPVAPVNEDLGEFWRMGRLAESVLRPTGWSMGNDPARLLQSLGEPQLEGIREGLFLPMLEATYRQVAESMRRLPKDA